MTQSTRLTSTTAFASLIFFLLTVPIYFFVNAEQNREFVALFTLTCFLILFSFSLLTSDLRQSLLAIYLYLILLITFQFPMVGSFFFGTDPEKGTVRDLLAIKSLLAFAVAFIFVLFAFLNQVLLKKGKVVLYLFDKVLILFFLLILISFIVSPASLEPRLAYMTHSIGSFCLTYLLFRLYKFEARHLKTFGKMIAVLGLFLFVVGVVIYPFQEEIWRDYLKVHVAYASMGGIPEWPPPWFNTTLILGKSGIGFKRLVSLVGNPITLGYLTVFGYAMSLYLKKKLTATLLAIATILILSKGAILLLLTITFFYFFRIRRVLVVILLDFFLSAASVIYSVTAYAGPKLRLQAIQLTSQFLLSNFGLNSLFGYGLGAGGTLAAQAGSLPIGADSDAVGAESALASIIFQLGFFGGLLFVLFLLFFQIEMIRRIHESDHPLYRLSLGTATGFLVISVFQESIISLTVFIPYMILLAIAANHREDLQPA